MNEGALALGLKALELAQCFGAKVSFDPNIRPQLMPLSRILERYAPFVQAADILMPTGEELRLLTQAASIEAAVENLLMERDRIIVIAGGALGCAVHSRSGAPSSAAFVVDEVDPSSAGDCFDAGFLAAWLEGADLADCARFASACGAIAVGKMRLMAGARSRGEVEAFIAAYDL